MSEELIRKVNELTAEQEQADGALYTVAQDGDRRIILKRDLTVEFSNNTTQVKCLFLLLGRSRKH